MVGILPDMYNTDMKRADLGWRFWETIQNWTSNPIVVSTLGTVKSYTLFGNGCRERGYDEFFNSIVPLKNRWPRKNQNADRDKSKHKITDPTETESALKGKHGILKKKVSN